jgi:ribonuclease HI
MHSRKRAQHQSAECSRASCVVLRITKEEWGREHTEVLSRSRGSGCSAMCGGGTSLEEEDTSSNRPELAALVLALRKTRFTNNLLYLCDNQLLLKTVQKWNWKSVRLEKTGPEIAPFSC